VVRYSYNNETGLFYVGSRYYDSQKFRFINADEASYIHSDSPICQNLFSYCANNLVMYIDPTGFAWWGYWRWTNKYVKKESGYVW
jgi:RHS repeat-associated protein